jgi:Protein kinase domain
VGEEAFWEGSTCTMNKGEENSPLDMSMDDIMEVEKGNGAILDEQKSEDAEEFEKMTSEIGAVGGMPKKDRPDEIIHFDTVSRWTMIEEKFAGFELGFNRESVSNFLSLIQQIPFHSKVLSEQKKLFESFMSEDESTESKMYNSCLEILRQTKTTQWHIANALLAHIIVRNKLIGYSGRSQSDAVSQSTTSMAGQKRKGSDMTLDSEYKKDLEYLPHVVEEPIENWETLAKFQADGPRIGFLEDLPHPHQELLKQFGANLGKAFQFGKLVNSTFEDSARAAISPNLTKQSHNEGCYSKVSKEDFQKSLIALEAALLHGIQNRFTEIYVPAVSAGEVSVTQPILLSIIDSLASVVDSTGTNALLASNLSTKRFSPLKTSVQTNRNIPHTKTRPKRTVDKSVAAAGRFVFLLRDDVLEIPIEEKSGERVGVTLHRLLCGAENQIVSQTAKHLGIGFNFKGIGVDTRATGIVLSPAYLKIIQLRLINVGTPSVEVQLYATKCLPLLPKEQFLSWIEHSKQKDHWSEIVQYNDNEDVPSGLVALWNIMTSSRTDLFGPPSFEKDNDVLGEMIGYGAFSTIHRSKTSSDVVIKVSRYGARSQLDREAEVLGQLKDIDGISQLIGLNDIDVTVSELRMTIPALSIKPFAKGVRAYLAGQDDKVLALRRIGDELSSALSHVHSRGYVHNDPSPQNILVHGEKAILIDFGLASRSAEQIKGFRGTTLFAHRFVFSRHSQKGWRACAEYDFSSLAFSLAALSNDGIALWKSFDPRYFKTDDFEKWAHERSEKSWQQLELFGFQENIWKSRCYDLSDGDSGRAPSKR